MSKKLPNQIPPSSLESELALLAGFMVRGRVDPDCDLRADQFYDPRHGAIYSAMSQLEAEMGQWDSPALVTRLHADPQWEKDGFNGAYVGEVASHAGNPAVGAFHSRQIKEAWRRRVVGDKALELLHLSRNGFDPDRLDNLLGSIKRVCEEEDGVGTGQVISRTLDTVQAKKIEWLWPNRIPLGKYTEIIGYPGIGKTVLHCNLMARVSSGQNCPDCDVPMGPGGVVFMTAEDDAADTIKPRLDAAGADCSRIRLVESVGARDPETGQRTIRSISLDRNVPAIEQAIEATPGCKLVVIDPITAYCGKTDSHKAAEVRALLVPLTEMAVRHNVAVVGVTHFNKGGGGGPAVGRGMGSLAWVAAARMAWGVVRQNEEPAIRLMLPIKCNLAGDIAGLSYKIVDQNGVPVVEWMPDQITTTVDEVLTSANGTGRQSPKRRDVKAWLKSMVDTDPVPANDILNAEDGKEFGERLIRWAKKELGIESFAEGFGANAVWFWRFPKND